MHTEIPNPRWRGKRSRCSRRMRNPQFFRIWREAHGIDSLSLCWRFVREIHSSVVDSSYQSLVIQSLGDFFVVIMDRWFKADSIVILDVMPIMWQHCKRGIHGLVQDWSISIANTLGTMQSCINPSIWFSNYVLIRHHKALNALRASDAYMRR